MPSVPTTSLDLGDADVVADPYPHFARERSRHEVAWHEPSGTWLTFSHAAAGAVLRDRRLGRIWRDREPAAYLEPFNLLHRNQMMENEPPQHTRLRRAVASAFNRGHVERLRPRVQSLAAELLDGVDPAGFDVIGEYAEPLPVLVIAELIGLSGADVPVAAELVAGDRADVRAAPSSEVVDAAVTAAGEFADHVREHLDRRRTEPADDLTTDLLAAGLSDDELVAAVVLLLNAGHEASVNVFGNGLVALLGTASSRRPGDGPRARRSRRCCASTRPSSSSSAPPPHPWSSGEWSSRRARRSPRCSAPPTGTRRCSPTRTTSTRRATRTRTSPSGPGCTSAWALRSPGWS